jgi:thiamine biosynthesis lipoprotein ApbE
MLQPVRILTAFLLLAAINGKAFPPGSGKHYRLFVSHYENVLGTSLELKVSASSPAASEKAEAAVLKEIGRLADILSGYDPHSEFSRWMKTAQTPVRVSPELFEVLGLFDQWRIRTDGALDASAEVITKLWKQAAANGRLPSDAELAKAVSRVRQTHWKLDSAAGTATHLSDAPLMLNSFAKSYIIRHAADAGRAFDGVDAIIVNIGGDLVISGNLNETVLISDPKDDAENAEPIDQLQVTNRAVATSGNYRRGELIGGHWYSHIVDPRTGQPAGYILSATVVASNATDAGALATAFNVLSTDESIRLAATVPGAEYLIITAAGDRIASRGWKDLETAAAPPRPARPPGNFELLINLEVNMQTGANNYKRPYVAVWVEDEDHAPVRAISVWRGETRYLRELKSWYLKYGPTYGSDPKFDHSITSATRAAGKYSLKWDGIDDQGKPVKPGKYILKIEVAREHGTYQIMRLEIDCDDQPKVINLTGNIEISSATLDYRKTTNGQ